MGRLANLKPSIGALPAPLAFPRDEHGHSATAEPWRKWYSLARWKSLRAEVLLRDMYQCQCGCGHIDGRSPMLVADHKRPHRGDPKLFWDPNNIHTLYKPCHDRAKQAEEHRLRSRGEFIAG